MNLGVEVVVHGNVSLTFVESDAQQFNVCVLVIGLPEGGLECDMSVLFSTEDGSAG